MPDFAVRVRGAKGRSWRSPRRLVAVYLGLWVFALVVFLLMDPTDAMGYALLFHWLLLPIAAFVISLRIGELVRRDGRMWLLPLALGLLYMLADFLTFRLANMLAFDKINLPNKTAQDNKRAEHQLRSFSVPFYPSEYRARN